jgi:hypothetical protein
VDRSTGVDRRSLAVGLAVVAIIAVAVLKPWGTADVPPPPSHGPAPAAARATPGPSLGTPVASGRAAVSPASSASEMPLSGPRPGGQCQFGDMWRVFTIAVDAGRRVYTWLPVEPVTAATAGSATIPWVRVVADRVSALGFCARVDPARPRPITGVEAWVRPAPGIDVPVDIAPLAAWTPRDPDAGRVFRLVRTPGAENGDWPPGDYVLVVHHGRAADDDWIGVRIATASSGSATPSTTAP